MRNRSPTTATALMWDGMSCVSFAYVIKSFRNRNNLYKETVANQFKYNDQVMPTAPQQYASNPMGIARRRHKVHCYVVYEGDMQCTYFPQINLR